jgi:hypothetical protein
MSPATRASTLLCRVAIVLFLALASPAAGFSVLYGGVEDPQQALADAARWAPSTGLSDGIQVGVEPGFAAELGATNATEEALVDQAVIDAITAWESPALTFDVTLEAAGVEEGSLVGFEIDLFAVPGTHPRFAGTGLFGLATPFVAFDPNRTLTNGQLLPGNAIFSADVYINVTNATTAAALLDLTPEQQLAALTRLVMHEVGHAIGLGHPNVQVNYDTDLDPTNPMPIDPNDPFAALILSPIWNQGAVMSSQPCGPVLGACAALFFTSPTNDDVGGRDALYPVLPEPGIALLLGVASCAALARSRRST